MRIRYFFFLLTLPLAMVAQERTAVQVLEQAVNNIEADAAVQMTFDYVVYDETGVEQFADKGSLKLDGDSYAVLLSPMRLWCDGETQWSYIAANNEVYITEADSDEAQIYNPVFLMNLYKEGYNSAMEVKNGSNVVTLTAASDELSFEKVVITLDAKTLRPAALCVYVNGQGYTDIAISGYKPKCSFDERVYRCPLEDFPGAEVVDMR